MACVVWRFFCDVLRGAMSCICGSDGGRLPRDEVVFVEFGDKPRAIEVEGFGGFVGVAVVFVEEFVEESFFDVGECAREEGFFVFVDFGGALVFDLFFELFDA